MQLQLSTNMKDYHAEDKEGAQLSHTARLVHLNGREVLEEILLDMSKSHKISSCLRTIYITQPTLDLVINLFRINYLAEAKQLSPTFFANWTQNRGGVSLFFSVQPPH